MKKLIFSLIAVLMGVVGAHAQISYDKTSNGNRIIEAGFYQCSKEKRDDYDRIHCGIRVSLSQSDDKLSWSLLIRIPTYSVKYKTSSVQYREIMFRKCPDLRGDSIYLPTGGRMLIKLDDEEVIELKQSLESKETYKEEMEYNSLGHEHIGCLYGRYSITENEIKKIVSHTVTKVRVERNAENKDYAYMDYDTTKVEKFSNVVATEYEAVLKALDSKKDFYSDF